MSLYDICWLADEKINGYKTYFLDEKAKAPVKNGIIAEIEASFGSLEANENDANLILKLLPQGNAEAFALDFNESGCCISSAGEQGLLYGLYALIRLERTGAPKQGAVQDAPANNLRMFNHWDAFDGTIERGYAGRSIFYENDTFVNDLERVEHYARMLASVGINGISLNNVNVRNNDLDLITTKGIESIKAYCDILIKYAVKPFMSVNFASPVIVGGLENADPLDEKAIDWWQKKTDELYSIIPYFGGFVVKADSEGEPGPHTYGRNHAEGANMFANALAAHGGIVIWRCFVYNHKQDWRDRSTDRAKAAYELFKPLDGKFLPNAILQVKFGPIDFQIREPVSPLIGALQHTNLIVEMQVTQEYTGHQLHICHLAPQWKEILEFDTHQNGKTATVRELIGNKANFGMTAVVNVGRDYNWTGHKIAQANFYCFARLAWQPLLSAEEITREWIKQSFKLDKKHEDILCNILLSSRKAYEDYTVPLGVGFMCNPMGHYGPGVDGYEYDRWGTYHFADRNGVGYDRTQKSGTGFTAQYNEPNSSMYENLATCPDELLLFFHHVPYTHVLHSGKTVIQHIYDTHFDGYKKAEEYAELWREFEELVPNKAYLNVQERLEEQLRCAREWRDQINTYFYRKSGIIDDKGRKIYQ